ncbi:hypothetical protein Zm00014a_037026 [Zea mays]|nr:hypothetical protein Zm00014a_037026 [Zea mays]
MLLKHRLNAKTLIRG